MVFRESETVELKEAVTDEIKKEIIAFANCDGGRLYIGVQDDGTVVGLDDPDHVSLQISNMVRDSIKPDVTMFLHYETIEEDGREIIAVDVQRGTDRPYYLIKKGMQPAGVYVRQGYSAVPATDAAIRRMIKETDGDCFESLRCLNQELTFEVAKEEFQLRNVDFDSAKMRTLKLIDRDDLYTNLALLLSDQCSHKIKAAVFQGTDQTVFKNRREFTGSLLKQMNEVYDFIDFHNQTRATIRKLLRTDIRDYPQIAVREALLNLLVHREYSFSASALISIFTDRIEFVSIGGLVPGIDLEDIMVGISVCRNQNLANVFYRLQLIEAYGTGISKIMKAYENVAIRECSFDEYVLQSRCDIETFCDKDFDTFISGLEREDLYKYISRLRPNEQKALLLYYVYGHKLNEIAEVLGETSSNVRSLSRRAKLKLRKMFEEGGDL